MPDKFCGRCGTVLTNRFESGRERPSCPHCGFVLYRNPIPVVVMVSHRDGEFLLIKRRDEPLAGFWAPPTGYVEWDESLEEAGLREVREETGLEVRSDGLLGIYSRSDTGILFVAYFSRIIGGRVQASDDAESVGFFTLDALPAQPSTHRGTLLDEWFVQVIVDALKQGARRL